MYAQVEKRKVNTKSVAPLQRVILNIGDPNESGIEFPALSALLLEKKGAGKIKSFYTYSHPESSWPSFFRKKDTLYIVTHGSPTGIIGFNDAGELAEELNKKNLTDKTLSKIILVACSTGSGSTGIEKSFALELAQDVGVNVFYSSKPIDVHYNINKNNNIVTPTHFTIDGTEVDIVNGVGLKEYKPSDTEENQSLL